MTMTDSSKAGQSGALLTLEEEQTLLVLAGNVIAAGARGQRDAVAPENYSPALRDAGAAFVTLHQTGQLRGCIGSLEARQALVLDVADNAWAAAFRDPRFPPVTSDDIAELDIHISVLSPATPMQFESEADLLAQVRPGVDGLVLEASGRRGTFLPSVWEQLPRPEEFLQHLKLKAGLPADYWSATLRISRYTTHSFGVE